MRDGDAGVADTIAKMAAMIRASIATPIVRGAATSIVGGMNPNDFFGQLYAIREFLQQNVKFLRDPTNRELLHDPEWMLRQIASQGRVHVDCDDVAILGGAIAGAVGLRVKLIAVAFLDTAAPSRYTPLSHVWASATAPVQMLDGDGKQIWIELDTTRPFQNLPLSAIARWTDTLVL